MDMSNDVWPDANHISLDFLFFNIFFPIIHDGSHNVLVLECSFCITHLCNLLLYCINASLQAGDMRISICEVQCTKGHY